MNQFAKLLLVSSALAGAQAASAACEYPNRVSIPDGKTATQEEMLEGQSGVRQYVSDMETYLECIVAEEKAARDAIGDLDEETEQQREDLLTKRYNAAVEEMEKVAAQFNSQVQAFRSRDN